MESYISKRLKEIEDLPPVPRTLQEVFHSLDSITTSAKTLEEIIKKDPVLTAKVLKMANSPYYGVHGEINSISKAIVLLGFDEIRNLVIGLSVTATFSRQFKIKNFSTNDLWFHSIGVAYCSKMLGERCDGMEPDELFTIGLIHDLGRFLMPFYFVKELEQAVSMSEQMGIGLIEAEERLGISHAEIGAFLAILWQLSDLVVTTIRYHHHPKGAGQHSRTASVIYVADQLVQKIGQGWNLDYKNTKLFVPKVLGLNATDIKAIARELKKNMKSIKDSWSTILD